VTYSNLVIDGKYQVKALGETADGIEVVGVCPETLVEVACFLQKDRETSFNVLLSVYGTDKLECFEVVYHLFSTKHNKSLLLKVFLDKNEPQVESLACVYPSANWHERETYDLLGIIFLNHPELERILLPKDWKGHPLRKNYVNDDERLVWNER
jgi:NADH-quinone oxidoreductase subunit C